jgi:hypothetical protein
MRYGVDTPPHVRCMYKKKLGVCWGLVDKVSPAFELRNLGVSAVVRSFQLPPRPKLQIESRPGALSVFCLGATFFLAPPGGALRPGLVPAGGGALGGCPLARFGGETAPPLVH